MMKEASADRGTEGRTDRGIEGRNEGGTKQDEGRTEGRKVKKGI
jgi:hypothetical protein